MKNKYYYSLFVFFFSFLASILLFSGCTPKKSTSEEHLAQLLISLFTPLTQEEYQQWEEFTEETTQLSYPEWAETRFYPHMSDSAYESLLQTSTFTLPVLAYDSNSHPDLQNLSIQKGNNRYSFEGSLCLTKNKKDITLQIEGTAQTDNDGKITHLEFYRMDELIAAFS